MNESFTDGTVNEVISYIDMFRARMVFIVLGDGNGRDVVNVDSDGVTSGHAISPRNVHIQRAPFIA